MCASHRNVSVLIADDHAIVRKGLRALLEAHGWCIVGEADNGRGCIDLAAQFQPHLVVLDITMRGLNGIDTISAVLKVSSYSRVLVFSMHDEEDLILRTFEAGARGYVLKSDVEQSLLKAVNLVSSGMRFVSPSVPRIVSGRIFATPKRRFPDSHLTGREHEVVQLLAEGMSNKQIATALDISVRTAENHRARLMKKLGIHSLSGLVRYAIRNNIIQA